MKAPVSMPMRLGRTSGTAVMVWPWTTIAPEVGARTEEPLADPQQVFRLLPLQRHARLHPGMDEGVIALLMQQRQPVQEVAMRARQKRVEFLLRPHQLERPRRRMRRVDAVARQRLPAAIGEPVGTDRDIDEEAQHEVLVVALEVDRFESGGRRLQEQVDDLARLGAAVDVIAEIDHDVARRRPVLGVGRDHGVQKREQVGAAVDVADGIEPRAGGSGRLGRIPCGAETGDHCASI